MLTLPPTHLTDKSKTNCALLHVELWTSEIFTSRYKCYLICHQSKDDRNRPLARLLGLHEDQLLEGSRAGFEGPIDEQFIGRLNLCQAQVREEDDQCGPIVLCGRIVRISLHGRVLVQLAVLHVTTEP